MIDRTADIMKQGCMKRPPAEKGTVTSRRIKAIKAALAGKSGFQSEWATGLMRQELTDLAA